MAEHTRRQKPFTAHDISSYQAAKELGSNPETGLSGPECSLRQKKYGKNELAHKKKANPVLRFWASSTTL